MDDGRWTMDDCAAVLLWEIGTKPRPVILSVAKDLKKLGKDAVEYRDGAEGSTYWHIQHLRSFATLRMTGGAGF
ncbi:MAG: hypothetical protein M3437_15665, partial [Chloroflexota bacterium]|nr:hypothetical protein [Chloroflexota bacterium]